MVRRFHQLLALGCAASGLLACVAVLDLPAIEIVEGDAEGDGAPEPSGDGASPDAEADVFCAADTSTDPANCGRCGRRCPSGCTDGGCAPITLAPVDAQVVTGLAVSSTDVYFVLASGPFADGDLRRCAKSGCNQIAAPVTTGIGPVVLSVSDTHAAWHHLPPPPAVYAEARACALANCSGTVRTFPGFTPAEPAIAADVLVSKDLLYWSDLTAIQSCPADGCATRAPIATNLSFARNLALSRDGSRLVFFDLEPDGGANGQRVRALVLPQGAATTIAVADTFLVDLVVTTDDAVFLDEGGTLRARRLDGGGNTRTLRAAFGRHIAADASYVYFLSTPDVVARCRPDACVEEVVAAGLEGASYLAVDDLYVYVATSSGIVELAKP